MSIIGIGKNIKRYINMINSSNEIQIKIKRDSGFKNGVTINIKRGDNANFIRIFDNLEQLEMYLLGIQDFIAIQSLKKIGRNLESILGLADIVLKNGDEKGGEE